MSGDRENLTPPQPSPLLFHGEGREQESPSPFHEEGVRHSRTGGEVPYDIACIGNYTKDTIVSPAGTRNVDGGAMNYAANAAARLGLRACVVTRLAAEDERVLDALRAAGVDCFVEYTPQSTCLTLTYPTENPDIRTLTVTGSAGSITPAQVAPVRARAAVIGSTIRGEVGLDVVEALDQPGRLLAADVQGFLRVLREGTLVPAPWEEMDTVLAHLDVLKTDAVEAEALTGERDIYRAARLLAAKGPREIVLTHQGGVLVHAGGQDYEAAFYPRQMVGRSGRGDTCLGTYVSMRLSRPPAEACVWAAAVTSLKMERLGPFNGTKEQVEALLREKYAGGA